MSKLKLLSMTTCLAGMVVATSLFAATPTAPYSTETVNRTTSLKPIGQGAKGASVLRAQILLDRARFSTGEMDGSYGSNMRQAIAGFQRKYGLAASGTVNAATWVALNTDTSAALVSYVIVDSDIAGPFAPVPAEMADKAKLTRLGFASAEEALGEKFHLSPALLKRLNPGKNLALAGESIVVPNVSNASPLPNAAKIIISESTGTLLVVDKEGKTIAQYPATTGSKRDPLPLGSWKVTGVAKNPVFHYNPKLFWDASAGDEKATIQSGPNNPVGVAWVDLTKAHYGIHGTPSPATIGKTQSHGCIRLTNWDVMALTQAVAPGTMVVMQK